MPSPLGQSPPSKMLIVSKDLELCLVRQTILESAPGERLGRLGVEKCEPVLALDGQQEARVRQRQAKAQDRHHEHCRVVRDTCVECGPPQGRRHTDEYVDEDSKREVGPADLVGIAK
eukprot:CAMPEP_0197564956 /NCGR_PEP_ID=MMETSP1320-20131121/31318_1 /TAXON_ID=91990 /ORGANISM="Bolidomonas sp., Strain RCC2347" /LENGTH=116 /DNA_ID=CAMNT_0043126901 /DNA_START=88 /DNA_END=436 /DNA_ORIENTATION=-